MKIRQCAPLLLLAIIVFLFVQSAGAEEAIIVDFYYSSTCGSCKPYISIVEEVKEYFEANYSEMIIFNFKEVGANTTNYQEMHARGLNFPSAIINNHTKIFKANLNNSNLRHVIEAAIKNLTINQTPWWIITFPFIGQINVTALSLPVSTIVLGVLDSFNLCSFFILIFLMNLLLYLQSKQRMLLVGGIFIFFSGLFYVIFMIMLYLGLAFLTTYVTFITIIAGIVSVLLGIFNIKDFFFFKKGPTLGISEEKQKETFHRIRKIVKSPSLLIMLSGTIILSVTVNLYELLCTLIYPWVYVNILIQENLPFIERVVPFIISYCIIYVIPLFIIVFLFAFTLGTRKISEWQGRQLKLLSGIMIFSFGLCFIIDYQLLENLFTPLGLLGLSVLLTLLISYLWKRYKKQPEEKQEETPMQSLDH